MLELPEGIDELRVVNEALQRSVVVNAIGQYCSRTKRPPALILGYGGARDSAIEEGIRRLAAAIDAASSDTRKAASGPVRKS